MVKLFFALVGEGDCLGYLTVRSSDRVTGLIEQIRTIRGWALGTRPDIRLFLAKQNGDAHGPWLEEGEDELEQLFELDLPAHLQDRYLREKLRLKLSAQVSRYFPDEHDPSSLQECAVHLLVDVRPPAQRAPAVSTIGLRRSSDQAQLVDTNATPLKRQSLPLQWTREREPCPQLSFDESDKILRIPANYLVNSGVVSPQSNADLLLYRRAALVDQWNEIQRDSVDSYARLWIVGGPGLGKSCGAYAFACGKVDRTQWDVIWMHYSREFESIRCIKFHGDGKATCILPLTGRESLAGIFDALCNLLLPSSSSHNPFVFFDGYVEQYEPCEQVRQTLEIWQNKQPMRRRLVCVASMPRVSKRVGKTLSFAKVIPPTAPRSDPLPAPTTAEYRDELRTVMDFHLVAWTLKEFEKAIVHDEFFGHVQHNLLRVSLLDTEKASYRTRAALAQRVDLVRQKYFVAGGNARFMFTMSMAGCIDTLENAMDCVGDFESALHGCTGPNLVPVAYNLIARYFHHSEIVLCVASAYVAKRLAMCLEPSVIQNCAKVFNSTTDVWVLPSIAHGGLEYSLRGRKNGRDVETPQRWEQQSIRFFDPSADFKVERPLEDGWFVPMQWKGGSYDAVFIERADGAESGRLRFIQVAQYPHDRQQTHSFEPKPLQDLLRKLQAAKIQLNSVEFVYVVPRNWLKDSQSPVSSATFKAMVKSVFSKVRSQVSVAVVDC